MVLTRSSALPARSIAVIVLSKLGGAGSAAMRSTSARFSAIAASSAGLISAGLNFPNGGIPPQGPVHGASTGFIAVFVPLAVGAGASGFVELVAHAATTMSKAEASAGARKRNVMFHLGWVQGSRVPRLVRRRRAVISRLFR